MFIQSAYWLNSIIMNLLTNNVPVLWKKGLRLISRTGQAQPTLITVDIQCFLYLYQRAAPSWAFYFQEKSYINAQILVVHLLFFLNRTSKLPPLSLSIFNLDQSEWLLSCAQIVSSKRTKIITRRSRKPRELIDQISGLFGSHGNGTVPVALSRDAPTSMEDSERYITTKGRQTGL